MSKDGVRRCHSISRVINVAGYLENVLENRKYPFVAAMLVTNESAAAAQNDRGKVGATGIHSRDIALR